MATNGKRSILRRFMGRRPAIAALLALAAICVLIFPSPQRVDQGEAVAAQPVVPNASFRLPANIQPCAKPGTYVASRPPHPYQYGDPVCDASGFAVAQPNAIESNPVAGSAGPLTASGEAVVGVQNNIDAYGIYVGRQVTAISYDSDDTVYVTMHAGTSDPTAPWVEVGWQQFGDGSLNVFTCCANYGHLVYPQYAISPGDTIYVDLEAEGNDQWLPMIYWNGQWDSLELYTSNTNYTDVGNMVVEAYPGSDGTYPTIPQTNTYNAQEYVCNPTCGWQLETASATNAFKGWEDAPYHFGHVNDFYNWYGYGGS